MEKIKDRMIILKHNTLRTLTTLIFVFIFSLPCYAVNDLLLLPAEKSEKAINSMLLDVVNNGTRLVAVGERGHILYSEDNGLNWQQAKVPISVTLTAVYFPTSQKGWVVGHDGIVLHTEDGGKSWKKQVDGFELNRLNLAYAKTLIASREAALAGASKQEEGDLKRRLEDSLYALDYFKIADESATCEPLMDVWFRNEDEGFVIGAFGQIYHTTDGGITWMPCWDLIDNPDWLHWNAITQAKGALFIAGEAGTLYRSMDDGKSWDALASPYEGSYFGIIASPEEEYVIAFGLGGNAAHSVDLGETWKHIKTKSNAGLTAGTVCSDGNVLIVSFSGFIFFGSGKTGSFSHRKVEAGRIGVAQTNDGHIVLVGLKGAQRIESLRTEFGGAEHRDDIPSYK